MPVTFEIMSPHDEMTNEEVKSLIDFSLPYISFESKQHIVYISFVERETMGGCLGSCIGNRKWTDVKLCKDLPSDAIRNTLAHELTHARQMADGTLVSAMGFIGWKGKMHRHWRNKWLEFNIKYRFLSPWETEARQIGKQVDLAWKKKKKEISDQRS